MSGRPYVDQLRELYRRQAEAQLHEATLMRAAIDDGLSARELAAELGLSKTHVYARLRLLRLSPASRKALMDGRLPVDVAQVLADGSDAEQGRALAKLERAGALTVREALKVLRG